jgi:hypothetical protein
MSSLSLGCSPKVIHSSQTNCIFNESVLKVLVSYTILSSFRKKYLFKSRCAIGCVRLWRYSIPLATSTAMINLDCKSRILELKIDLIEMEWLKWIPYLLKEIKWYMCLLFCIILPHISLLQIKLKIQQILNNSFLYQKIIIGQFRYITHLKILYLIFQFIFNTILKFFVIM